MASTFSPSLRLELVGDGDQSGIWGQTTNNNLGGLIEQAIAGVITISMGDANYTLTNFNGILDEARNAVLVVGGTNSAIRKVVAPLENKTYIIRNQTVGGFGINIGGASGAVVLIPNGVTTTVYCDGVDFFEGLNGVATNLTVGGVLNGTTAVFSGAISSVSPALTGTPTAPTAAPGTNTTQIATTAYTTAAVTTATGSLGTMSTQNANAVDITGGTITVTTASDSLGNLRNIPINSKTTGYTLLVTDNGQCISITTGGVTVPNSVFSAGQTVAIFNNSATNQTITQGAGVTMYQGGTATTGNRTLAGRGLATILFITSSTAVITGAGVI